MLAKIIKYFKNIEQELEGVCVHCGGCCGAFDDPCACLKKDANGKYFCEIYDYRFGPRQTISGKKFHCISINNAIYAKWQNDDLCG